MFAAWGGSNGLQGLWVFKRGKRIAEFDLPTDLEEPITQILIFGTWIVGCCPTRIEVWKSATYEHYTTLYPTAAQNDGNELTGGITNMPTYLNKIWAGRKDGSVEIWNVSSGKLIYTILPPAANCGAVTALRSTPALDVLAIAYSEGPLIIHNVRTDKTHIHLNAGMSNSVITSISFRTDDLGAGEDGRKSGVMATAGPGNVDVTFWDLNDGGRVMGVLRGAHNPHSDSDTVVRGGISKVEYLTGQPVIVTSGLDNSLKSWIFDQTPYSPLPRILHSRSGHAGPVTRLQWLPTDSDGADAGGKWLLSAGKDRSLWGWSLRRDGQSTELSQGNISKRAKKFGILANASLENEPSTTLEDLKAPEIICMATCLNRDGGMGANAGSGSIWQKGSSGHKNPTDATASGVTGWESVVTGHKDDKYARTWFWGRKKAGRWAFETGDGGNVKSVAITVCGTFAVVGSENGGIDMFNLQSGLRRQRYPSSLTLAQAKKLKIQQMQASEGGDSLSAKKFQPGMGKHTKAVTGLVVDSLNKNVISCSLDGKIKFWDFSTGNLVSELDWHPTVALTGIRYLAANDLIALTCDDLTIRVVDTETKRLIRQFSGCQSTINDFCFSNDGRWVIAGSQDCVVRVWDLPTGHLVDGIRMETPCTSLAFSGTGEFLAITCEGQVGVNIWNNKTLFTHVPTRHISEAEIAEMAGPTGSGEGGQSIVDAAFEDEAEYREEVVPALTMDNLSDDLITLSLVPKAKSQTLLHLDLIKQRNKPKEAPKVPEKAPFFLPSVGSVIPGQISEEKSEDDIAERSRIMKMDRLLSEGAFTVALRSGSDSGDCKFKFTHPPFPSTDCVKTDTTLISHLASLSPSAADLEIRSLSTEELVHFISALTSELRRKTNYELVQVWIAVFLKVHGQEIPNSKELKGKIKEWRDVQANVSKELDELIGFASGMVKYFRMGM